MRLHDDDRGVRNLVGFTLTFAIIVVAVGFVATTGYQQLGDLSRNEQLDNAESAMELVASDVRQLEGSQAVVRTNDLSLSGGSLTVLDGPTMRVRAENTDFDRTFDIGGLQYAYGRSTITVENGGVFWTNGEGNTATVDRPALTCTDEHAMVSVVRLTPASTAQTGADYVSVTTERQSSELRFPMNRTGPDSAAAADELRVTVSSPRSAAWGRYFESAGNWTAAASPDTYRCDGIDAMYVRETVVSVSIR
ncbi:hypothetical protein HZS55_03070 [Halosimplex rubrum]|uniref:Flagellin n=1 Tax=Halosimplex rubrum TaxID=869889 RepID=A0A7D5P367_9EURY|nr:hypothetical protein [Halosimplex rubrum]QLH76345.1 hypothetical protein HZS55_03070 [Halosimplex rubrum]